ncbi:hypothetical protein UFOVP129_66 [uncultured Caudovirales phage]|uniref:Uncharacterized protein n=1 Tax=uncultured Caudovirales phage TaxID=2100421 RepID=A0A6J5LA70_9CAUD|nr:hypothetical protein UFOVP129_66 [uncultured Caudovirales phage]
MEKIRINGSICLSEISAKFKEGHSAFSTAANGKIYMSFTGWVNSANDDFKDFSLQLNSKQDKQEAEGKVYVGNGKIKPPTANTPAPQPTQAASTSPIADDLPF